MFRNNTESQLTYHKRTALWLIIAFLTVFFVSCSEKSPTEGSISLSLSPTTATILTGSTRQFTASVTGTSNTAVSWSASGGSIMGDGQVITFIAPDTPESITLVVHSKADNSKSATATITVISPDDEPDTITVDISPKSADLSPNQTQKFTATVSGSIDTEVSWSTSCGVISGSGSTITYQAPNFTGLCNLTATSHADPDKQATVTINIDVIGISIEPDSITLLTEESQEFTATVIGATNDSVTWIASCGTIDGDALTILYTAPNEAGRCELVVTSNENSSKTATATIIVSEVNINLTPKKANLSPAQTQKFTATVSGNNNRNVLWSTSCGSVSGTGTTITYVAPNFTGTCIVLATSEADPTKQVSATVEIDTIGISIEPESANLITEQTQVFTATVLGTDDKSVSWTATCGSVSGTGNSITYTAPPSANTCILTATSNADQNKTSTAQINVSKVNINLNPSSTEVFVNQKRTFTASVTGSANTEVKWTLNEECGNITTTESGTTANYTAPASVPSSTCTIKVSSVADPTKQASSTIVIHPVPEIDFDISAKITSTNYPVDFKWNFSNPSATLPLTCELFVNSTHSNPTYSWENCGTNGGINKQSHSYASTGKYTAVLRLKQGSTTITNKTVNIEIVEPGSQLWLRHIVTLDEEDDGIGWHSTNSIAVDSQDNIYVTGFTVSGLGQGIGAESTFTLKYDTDGKLVWAKQTGTDRSRKYGIRIDPNDNIYLLESIYNDDNNERIISLVKHDGDLRELWRKELSSNITDITIDETGNLYLTGLIDDYIEKTRYISKIDYEGNLIWFKHLVNESLNTTYYSRAINVNQSGQIRLISNSYNHVTNQSRMVITKYDELGNRIWQKEHLLSEKNIIAEGPLIRNFAFDENDNIYVSGRITTEDPEHHRNGIFDLSFFEKYDSSGDKAWRIHPVISDGSWIGNLVPDSFGNIYLTGLITDPYQYDSWFSIEVMLAKFDIAGNQIWLRQFRVGNENFANTIAIANDGSIYIAGFTEYYGLFIAKYSP